MTTAWAQTPPVGGYTITEIGLTGNEYAHPSGDGTVRVGVAQQLNAGGQVAGYTQRYNAAAGSLGRDPWLFNGTTTQQIGLVGTGYEYAFTGNGGGTYRDGVAQQLNAAGHVTGITQRYSASGTSAGRDAWLTTGSTTHFIGLAGSGYEYTSDGSTFRIGAAEHLNTAGQVAGYARRYNASGNFLGQDVWLAAGSTTQRVGPTGSGYEQAFTGTGGGTYRYSWLKQLNGAGQVAGYTERYNTSGTYLGQDAWLATGSTTQILGLTGSVYDYATGGGIVRISEASHLNAAGQVTGFTSRRGTAGDSLGRDAWLATRSTTQLIGLTGAGYDRATFIGTHRFGAARHLNAAGQVAGVTQRTNDFIDDLGQDAWLATGSTTQLIGLTGAGYEYTRRLSGSGFGSGTYRVSITRQLNDAGQVAGNTNRYNSSGTQIGADAWLATGSATQLVGLTGSGYEYASGDGTFRSSEVGQLNAVGQLTGATQRRNASGGNLGYDAWLFNGTTTRQIGLTGSGYEYTFTGTGGGTYRVGVAQQLNAAGQIIGSTERRDASGASLGWAGWFYDDDTNLTTALEFSFRSTDNYSYTSPALLTDTGVVLGRYELFSGATSLGNRAFWWSLEAGFNDLGGLVDGGLTAEGSQYLSSVYSTFGAAGTVAGGSPLFILGTGQVIGQTGGQSVYLLSAVPEPATVGVLAVGALILQGRRRRLVG